MPFALLKSVLFLTLIVHCLPQEEGGDSSEDENMDAEGEPASTTIGEIVADDLATVEVLQDTTLAPPPLVCDFGLLTACFMNILDDWSWNLFTFKENIATINDTVCEHHKQMAKCVNFPNCTRQQVLNASSSVSDLLLHRLDSGTFLKSFFLNSYTCTEEGMEMVNNNRECLMKNHLNHDITKMSTYVEDQFRLKLKEQSDPKPQLVEGEDVIDYSIWYCNFLSMHLGKLYLTVLTECNPESAYLTCKSLTDAFLNVFPDSLPDCSVPCAVKPTTTAPPPTTTMADESDAVERPGQEVGQPPATDEETKSKEKEPESGSKSEQGPIDASCTFSVSYWLLIGSVCSFMATTLNYYFDRPLYY